MLELALRKAVRSALGRIVLANAADGHGLGLHALGRLRTIADEVALGFGGLPLPAKDKEGFRRTVENTCRGKPAKLGLRAGSRFLGANPTILSGSIERLTTVVPAPDIVRLVDPSDLMTLLGRLAASGFASGGIEPGSYAERRLMDRSAAARARRLVRLAPGEQLGNPMVWMTRTDLVDKVIDQAVTTGGNRAEFVTDRLGLLFPPFSPGEDAMNQRFALHVPFSVVARKKAFRPSVVEAAAYSRFKVRPCGPALPSTGWGATLDLGTLVAGGGLADGLDEITIDTIRPSDFLPGERIELELLGTLSNPRGAMRGRDCDDTVADMMMTCRTIVQLMQAFR